MRSFFLLRNSRMPTISLLFRKAADEARAVSSRARHWYAVEPKNRLLTENLECFWEPPPAECLQLKQEYHQLLRELRRILATVEREAIHETRCVMNLASSMKMRSSKPTVGKPYPTDVSDEE
jgi:hypothetical protein